MNDTTRRFLTEILQRVPEPRIVELRLFPGIRQGGIESGVAVLAVEPGFDAIPDATVAIEGEDALLAGESESNETMTDEVVLDLAALPGDASETLSELGDVPEADPLAARAFSFDAMMEVEFERERALDMAREGVHDEPPVIMGDATADDEQQEALPDVVVADAPPGPDGGAETIALGDILALPSPEPRVRINAGKYERLAILCARYRLVLKGPDRGKWDLEVMHQADAPLVTLERVVAGVVRRSGEGVEPERFTGSELRARLDAPPWVEGAAA